jgi:hypothetical protein
MNCGINIKKGFSELTEGGSRKAIGTIWILKSKKGRVY